MNNRYQNINHVMVVEDALPQHICHLITDEGTSAKEFQQALQTVINIGRQANSSMYKFNISGYRDFNIIEIDEFEGLRIDLTRDESTSVRKLSVIVFLNSVDDNETEVLSFYPLRNMKIYPKVGMLVLFPSFLQYRFINYQKGRKIMAGWLIGNHFR